MRSLAHHPIPHPLFSRSYPHERRNMRSVWPNRTVWEFRQHGRQTGTHAVSANIPAEDIGAWVHLVGTYDGANWNLYKNGELLASRADTVGCVPLTTNWYIGSSNGNARFFDGEIRDVSIWNTSLTASQAAAVYAETAPSADYPTVVTSYTYDAAGRLLTLTDPVGNTTSYTYDYRGLAITETNEKNAARHYAYDAFGRLVEKIDRNGRTTAYTYDSVGRLTSESWLGANDESLKTFTYTYDALGNLLAAGDGTSAYTYTYDNLNRVSGTTFAFDNQTAAFAFAYDLAGRQTQSSLTLNNVASRTNTTTYDYLGNATKIEQTNSLTDEIFAEFGYNPNGILTSVNRFEIDDNLITSVANTLYTYNANNAITSILHKKPDETSIVQHSYTYDETNNIVEYLNSIDGNTEYNYDFLGQLIGADYENTSLTDESYSYDSNGNRITANGDNYTTGSNNELTSDGSWSYVYDDEGNRISKTNSTNRELYEWDYRNRLTSVTQQEYNSTTEEWQTTQIIEYTYDYNNIWIRKTLDSNADGTPDSKTIFIPENYQTTVQIDHGTVSHHYLWMPNVQDELLADTSSADILWTLTDHLGSIRDVIQAHPSGIVTQAHIIYDAFGNIISCTDSAGQAIENPVLFAYTGKSFDVDTHLQNNINRWYDSAVGRWHSTDPIGFYGNDTNLYRYSGNRVPLLYDPMGLEPPPFYTDPGLQIAQKNRETLDERIRQQQLHEKWPDPDNHWNDDCVVWGKFRFCKSIKPIWRIKANVAEQKRVLNKMYQALEDCLCQQNATSEVRQLALSKLQALVKKAQSIPIPQTVDSCGDWVNSVNFRIDIPGIVDAHGIVFRTIPARHAAYKVTICDKEIFYLDNGWWNHISEGNHWFYWIEVEEM